MGFLRGLFNKPTQIEIALLKPTLNIQSLFINSKQSMEFWKFLASFFVTYARDTKDYDSRIKMDAVMNIISQFSELYVKNGGRAADIKDRQFGEKQEIVFPK